MDPASLPVVTRDRLAYFRELRARLDPSGDPADAMAERHVEVPGSASSRIAAKLSLAPSSSHLLIGGGGSGKTTQLLAAQRLVSQIPNIRALYIDVSKQHDIATSESDLALLMTRRVQSTTIEVASSMRSTPQSRTCSRCWPSDDCTRAPSLSGHLRRARCHRLGASD